MAARLAGVLRVAREAACHQFDLLIHRGGDAVNGSDKGSLPAAGTRYGTKVASGVTVTRDDTGRIILAVAALGWELLGVFGVGGIAPLTDLVWRAEENAPSLATLGVALAVIGFPAWLFYHFVFQKHRRV